NYKVLNEAWNSQIFFEVGTSMEKFEIKGTRNILVIAAKERGTSHGIQRRLTLVQRRSTLFQKASIEAINEPLKPFHQTHVERVVINGDYIIEGTDKGSWNSVWYVNSKISKHMTPSKDLFVKFKESFVINNEEHHDGWIPTHGIGEIELTTNERIFAVHYISYALGININVLSLKQLILQGFEVEVKDSECTLEADQNQAIDSEEEEDPSIVEYFYSDVKDNEDSNKKDNDDFIIIL
ncbi:hypothetical protein Tco_1116689, partial [Tanacetum coccineum]